MDIGAKELAEKAKEICNSNPAASRMWVRLFEMMSSKSDMNHGFAYNKCRSWADAAIVDAFDRGGWFCGAIEKS